MLGGDYNVVPDRRRRLRSGRLARRCAVPAGDRARASARLLNLGYTDAFRTLHGEPHRYTFWDYQAGRWQRDDGLRIDHLLLSPQAADLLSESGVDHDPRGKDKPSDHTPIWCELDIG